MKTDRKASWWKLNLLVVIMLAILFLVAKADMSPSMLKLLDIGIIVSGYVLVFFWVHGNATAL